MVIQWTGQLLLFTAGPNDNGTGHIMSILSVMFGAVRHGPAGRLDPRVCMCSSKLPGTPAPREEKQE